MIVCICARVNEATIRDCLNQGYSPCHIQKQYNICQQCCRCSEFFNQVCQNFIKKDVDANG